MANQKHLKTFTHRNIAADGRLTNFRWNGRPVNDGDIQQRVGSREIKVGWATPFELGESREGVLAYDCYDCFLGPYQPTPGRGRCAEAAGQAGRG